MDETDVWPEACWCAYSCGDFDGLLKCIVGNRALKVVATDLIRVYDETLSEEALAERCKELNPGLEVTALFLLKHLALHSRIALRDPASQGLKICSYDNDKLVLDLQSNVAGVPLAWKFILSVQSSDQFYKEVTLPMVVMMASLQKEQQELRKLIQRKEAEIKDHKLSGCNVSRKFLETEPFDVDVFRRQMLTSESFRTCLKSPLRSCFNSDTEELFLAVTKAHRELRSTSGPDMLPCIKTAESTAPVEPHRNIEEEENDLHAIAPSCTGSLRRAKKQKTNMRL